MQQIIAQKIYAREKRLYIVTTTARLNERKRKWKVNHNKLILMNIKKFGQFLKVSNLLLIFDDLQRTDESMISIQVKGCLPFVQLEFD